MQKSAAARHDTVFAYLGRIGQIALLTREGEVTIAKRIELGEQAVIRAVVACDAGVHEIRLLGDRLRSGAMAIREGVRSLDEEDPGAGRRGRCRGLGVADAV